MKGVKFMNKCMAVLVSILMLFTGVFFGTGLESTKVGEKDQVKNVILFIGDGMGENHLKLTKQKLGIELTMETFPYRGQSKTRSMTGPITDSAAGGTALSCGVRTENGYIGTYWLDPCQTYSVPRSITEIANAHGLRTGVVTTDSVTGATPAAFSAHTNSRKNRSEIVDQQMHSFLDIVWGNEDSDFDKATAEANGFTVVESESEMNALGNGSKSFAQFNGDTWKSDTGTDDPTLSEMTEKAISVLDNDKGFFLMVEGAHIDKHSHRNNADNMVLALQEFDKAIAKALDFAKKDGNTLIVVTADHETGGLRAKDGTYVYTWGQHTGSNVPLFVYGSSNFIENGEQIRNLMVPRIIAASLGFDESEFTNAKDKQLYTATVVGKSYSLVA